MAEVNLGNLTAYVRADLSDFTRSMQQAQQQLGQMQQRLQGQNSAQQQAQQSSQQLAAAYLAMAQAITQQTQAYSQAQAATLAFRQAQAQMAQQTQAQRAALQQAAQGIRQHAQELQSERLDIARSNQALRERQQALREAAQASRASSGFSAGVLQVAGGIGLATGIGALVSQMRDFAVSTVQVGARMEQLRASFSALAGSTSAGQQQFDQLFQTAQRLGVPFESLARGWRTLTAAATQAGLPLSDQRRLLEAVAREGQRVGATNEELTRAFSALGQMAGKGTVSMEELRQQLGEAIPTALAAMARGMGRSTDELIKLVEAGGVRFPTAARALTRGLEEIQSTGLSTATTLQASFNRFTNEVIRAKDELLRMGGPLKAATDIATSFLKVLSDSAQAQRQLREAREQEGRLGTGLREGDIRQLSTEQQRRLTQLNRLLGEQTLQLGDPNAPPMFQPTREEYIAQLKAERDAIYASAQALKDKTTEQQAATAAVNKARADEERQRDALADLTKQMDAITKAAADFRREAELSPGLYGREAGTSEEQERFQKERESRLKPLLEKLTQAVATVPQGVTIPPEMLERLRQFNVEYDKVRKTIEAIKEAETARKKEEREAAQDRAQALGHEIQLRTQLEQLQAVFGRAEESTAERARTQAIQQFVQAQRTIDQALKQLAESPALRLRVPEFQKQFEDLKAALPGAQEAAGLRAFNDAIEREAINPLERLAETYGLSKQARDADKASEYAAAAAKSSHAQKAKELADAIRPVALIEAQLTDLRRQADLSAPLGEKALKAVQDEADALKTLREDLEQVQQARLGQGGFPFGVSREELRLRQRTETDIVSPEGLAERERLLALRREADQLNYGLELFAQLAGGVGSAWTNALQSIADGTKTVSEAFRAMGQAILQTMTQIAAQEATRAFIQLGFRLLTGAVTTSVASGGGGFGTSSASTGFDYSGAFTGGVDTGAFQHGGIIRKPTLALLGEGSSNPEYVLNQRQMTNLMSTQLRTGASAGGGGEVHVHNHPSKAEAERAAAQDRGQGHRAIVNEVLSDLSRGEASQINRLMRTLQR